MPIFNEFRINYSLYARVIEVKRDMGLLPTGYITFNQRVVNDLFLKNQNDIMRKDYRTDAAMIAKRKNYTVEKTLHEIERYKSFIAHYESKRNENNSLVLNNFIDFEINQNQNVVDELNHYLNTITQ